MSSNNVKKTAAAATQSSEVPQPPSPAVAPNNTTTTRAQEAEVSVLIARSMRDVLDDLHTYYTKPLMKETVMVGGTQLWRPLEQERRRLQSELDGVITSGHIDRLSAVKYRIYCEELCDLTRVAADADVSARIRQQYAACVRDDDGGRLVTDAEEALEVLSESDDDHDDDLVPSLHGHHLPTTSLQPAPPPPKSLASAASKKKEDYRKKKEEEMRMFASCQVRDERGNLVSTLGPFPVPTLAERSMRPNSEIRSRRNLKKKAQQQESSGSEDDMDVSADQLASSSSSTGNPQDWVAVFRGVPADTQKKLLEALKVRTRPTDNVTIALSKAIFRLGLEKCIHTMEKQRMLETMLQKKWQRQQLIEQLEEDFFGTIDSSPELRRNAGIALGLTTTTTQDIYERTTVHGLQACLRSIRPRLLKKIYVDLVPAESGSQGKEDPSVDRQVEAIVWKVFPRERVRLHLERVTQKHKNRGISYVFEQTGARVIHNTGKIMFRLLHVSTLRKNSQRHYSPEFEYGGNRWSLLTMQSKDQLALYLCQTGTVHCKFILTLINQEEADSIRNEGSQRFHKTSAENDWGFNNIILLDRLLDPQNGFWDSTTDSIRVDISLMIISDESHAAAAVPSAAEPAPTAAAAATAASGGAAAERRNSEPILDRATQQQLVQQAKERAAVAAASAQQQSPLLSDAAQHTKAMLQQQQQQYLLAQQEATTQKVLEQLLEEERTAQEHEWRKRMQKTFKNDRQKMHKAEEKERRAVEKAEVTALEALQSLRQEDVVKVKAKEKKRAMTQAAAAAPPPLTKAEKKDRAAKERAAKDSAAAREVEEVAAASVSSAATSVAPAASNDDGTETVEALQLANAQLKEEVSQLTVDLSNLQAQRLHLENDVAKAKTSEGSARAALRHAKQKLATQRKALEAAREEHAALKAKREKEAEEDAAAVAAASSAVAAAQAAAAAASSSPAPAAPSVPPIWSSHPLFGNVIAPPNNNHNNSVGSPVVGTSGASPMAPSTSSLFAGSLWSPI
eukprot:PhM_4_TR10368/c0_g1_i1/m.27474